jgi:glyoxylase-like metal-dependent hydrolase (beta-lactamase superfamily II)
MAMLKSFFDAATNTVTYLVWDPATRAAAVIDPVLDFDPNAGRLSTVSADAVISAAAEENLRIDWILDTHAHADHLSGADYLRRLTGAKLGIGAQITKVQKAFTPLFGATADSPDGHVFDMLLNEGDTLPLGKLEIGVLHTPGHTPACVTYLIDDMAFVGDTLFMPDYGTARADFPGGDAATLYQSIQRILGLPQDTRVFVGHDYLPESRKTFEWETTVAEERARNIHVHDGVAQSDFVAMRTARDETLDAPTLILPSLQVNIQAGALPQPSASGRVFLKLPVNAL